MTKKTDLITIFLSKDRALQLDCALQSFIANCSDVGNTNILVYYNSSSERHEKSYTQLYIATKSQDLLV